MTVTRMARGKIKPMCFRLLIVLACCFVQANPFATVLTFGTLFIPLLERFEEDRATTAVVQALLMGMTMSTGIIWGLLCRKLGLPKLMFVGAVLVSLGYITSFFATSLYQLMFTTGIMSGIGTSMLYVCSSTTIAKSFEGKAGTIAMVLHNCATSTGALGYPFLLNFAVNKYEISGVFLILGGMNLNNFAVVLLVFYSNVIVNDPNTNSNDTGEGNTNTDRKLAKQFIPWLLSSIKYIKSLVFQAINVRSGCVTVATGVSVGCLNGFLVVTLDFFVSRGFSVKEGIDSYLVFNACSILGELLPVILHLKRGMNPIIIFILCPFCGCIGQILTLVAPDVFLIYIGSGLTGIAVGGLMSGASVALLMCVEKKYFNVAFGMLLTSIGAVSCACGPLYGWMRDELQSYDAVIALTVTLLGLSGFLSLATLCFIKHVEDEIDRKL